MLWCSDRRRRRGRLNLCCFCSSWFWDLVLDDDDDDEQAVARLRLLLLRRGRNSSRTALCTRSKTIRMHMRPIRCVELSARQLAHASNREMQVLLSDSIAKMASSGILLDLLLISLSDSIVFRTDAVHVQVPSVEIFGFARLVIGCSPVGCPEVDHESVSGAIQSDGWPCIVVDIGGTVAARPTSASKVCVTRVMLSGEDSSELAHGGAGALDGFCSGTGVHGDVSMKLGRLVYGSSCRSNRPAEGRSAVLWPS